MRIKPIIDQVSIVLLGAFNPAIFHPTWLVWKGLIPEETVPGASIQMIHPDISQFSVADMLFQVQGSRFLVQCDTIYAPVIRDAVLSIFQDHLPETPIWTMGINRKIEFSCGSEARRDQLGLMLAPPEPWGAWGKQVAARRPTDGAHGGLMRIVMREQPRPDKLKGYIQAELQPSPTDKTAVLIDVNSHFEIDDPMQCRGPGKVMETLSLQWPEATTTAADIAGELMLSVERIA